MEKKKAVCCGTCKYWSRRIKDWGYCRRNAPKPYILGPSSDQYYHDWQKARVTAEKDESKKGIFDWSPPINWQVLWPETKVADHCGEWVDSGGKVFFPPLE